MGEVQMQVQVQAQVFGIQCSIFEAIQPRHTDRVSSASQDPRVMSKENTYQQVVPQ